MDFNGSRRITSYYENVLSNPAIRGIERAKLADVRRNRAREATLIQPIYLPMTFTMTAAASNLPYRNTTPILNYDVVIVGAKTDCWPGFGRQVNVSLADGQENWVRNGNNSSVMLTTDDFAGSTVAAGGNPIGVYYFTQPLLLQKNSTLLVEMMKTDATAGNEIANLVFIAYRVYPQLQADITIDGDEQRLIDRLIALRETPLSKYMKVPITFPLAGVGSTVTNVYTPENDEPMILRGIRTNMSQSTLALGLEGASAWMASQTPIWALAAENQSQVENYIWFERGIYVHSNQSILISSAINGNIDQSNVDPATGNTITFLYDTV